MVVSQELIELKEYLSKQFVRIEDHLQLGSDLLSVFQEGLHFYLKRHISQTLQVEMSKTFFFGYCRSIFNNVAEIFWSLYSK